METADETLPPQGLKSWQKTNRSTWGAPVDIAGIRSMTPSAQGRRRKRGFIGPVLGAGKSSWHFMDELSRYR